MLSPESVSFVGSAILTVGETGEVLRESGAGEVLGERGARERLGVNKAGEIVRGGVGNFSKDFGVAV